MTTVIVKSMLWEKPIDNKGIFIYFINYLYLITQLVRSSLDKKTNRKTVTIVCLQNCNLIVKADYSFRLSMLNISFTTFSISLYERKTDFQRVHNTEH